MFARDGQTIPDIGALSSAGQPPGRPRRHRHNGGRGAPSRRNTETNVVSTAICAPWNKGKPSTRISMRRSSSRFGTTMSMSWILMLVVTRPPPSRHTRAAADSNDSRAPPPQRMLHGGHWNRVDGHTGKHGWKNVTGATDGGGARCGKLARRAWCAWQPDSK